MGETQSLIVDHLDEEVEIRVDEWGVPHIYASTKHDVFLAQGFNAARDRLFQLDFARRRGLGKLAEVFGPAFAEWDRAARLFIYRGDHRAEWLAYADDTKELVTSFVKGINAYIDAISSGEVTMPTEFTKLGYAPEKWAPEDLVRLRAHSLSFNAPEEAVRARLLTQWGESVANLRRYLEPSIEVTMPEDVDLSIFTEDVLKDYWLGTGPLALSADAKDQVRRGLHLNDGSNNWVIAGDKTATGRPILCNDPHRITSSMPSLRYIAHLSCPEFDVIGGGEPLLPGISIGHNGKIAFGLTIFAIDQEDLFVHVLNPDNSDEYEFDGNWRKFKVIQETIKVKGDQDFKAELKFSEFGPVIYQNEERGVAVSLAAAWLEPGGAPYLGSVGYMRTENIEDFMASMNRWCAPPENQIVAEPGGRIAWQPGGIIPNRQTWNGLHPVAGDGSHVWEGFHDNDVLPNVVKQEGFIATANNNLLPEGFPSDIHVNYEWYDDVRFRRITEWLENAQNLSVREAFDFQLDDLSLHACETLELLRDNGSFRQHRLSSFLEGWNYRMETDSRPAYAWEQFFWDCLYPQVLTTQLEALGFGDEAGEILRTLIPALGADREPRSALHLLREAAQIDVEKFDRTVTRALEAFDQNVDLELLPAWGDVHTRYSDHPLADLLIHAGVPESVVRSGEYAVSGSGDTVGLAGYMNKNDLRQIYGSSFRVAIDVGDWDNSMALNGPGQSGDLETGLQFEHMERWVTGEPFPLLYSRERVEKHTRQVITLQPK